jgi:hypothetical protein
MSVSRAKLMSKNIRMLNKIDKNRECRKENSLYKRVKRMIVFSNYPRVVNSFKYWGMEAQ